MGRFRDTSDKKPLRLVDANTTTSGVLVADYEPTPNSP
jgi:hypothetical protein